MNELKITKNSKLFSQLFNFDNPKDNIPSDLFKNLNCDIVALRFEFVKNESEIQQAIYLLEILSPQISYPLMLYGTGNDEIDKKLLPELIKNLDRKNCIISYANEQTYKFILPSVINGEHYIVLKTPIDINLAKELNILALDMGVQTDKIIMNPDIGGLGYGYEYGFSIMEKINLEGQNGDKYLNLPLISDASLEALKTKEAKSADFSKSWGNLEARTRMIELSAVSGVLASGANIVTLVNPLNIKILKEMVK